MKILDTIPCRAALAVASIATAGIVAISLLDAPVAEPPEPHSWLKDPCQRSEDFPDKLPRRPVTPAPDVPQPRAAISH